MFDRQNIIYLYDVESRACVRASVGKCIHVGQDGAEAAVYGPGGGPGGEGPALEHRSHLDASPVVPWSLGVFHVDAPPLNGVAQAPRVAKYGLAVAGVGLHSAEPEWLGVMEGRGRGAKSVTGGR